MSPNTFLLHIRYQQQHGHGEFPQKTVYGAACDGEDLYSEFRYTYQNQGEKPSAYLSRLEDKLDQVIGYDGELADKTRLAQFTRGCAYDEQLVHALNLRIL